MAPLDAALPLAERRDAAAVVRENLDLDMARPLEVLLDVQAAIAEGFLGLAPGRSEPALDLRVVADETHPLAAPACDGFQEHRIAEPFGFSPGVDGIAQRGRSAGNDGHSGGLHPATCFGLVPHGPDCRGRRAHEDEAR